MNITIFGTGYVGLITGTCLADLGHQVTCVDKDEKKIKTLKKGKVPIYEPGLAELLVKNIERNNLSFTNSAKKGIKGAEIIFIAVGTPSTKDGNVDLSHVDAVADEIGSHVDKYCLIANKSTVPVGTADRVLKRVKSCIRKRKLKINFDVCSNPEFLKEGDAIEDFMKPERIIVGAQTPKAFEIMNECYASFNKIRNKMLFMDLRSAELTKYAANAMLATKISFMNEMSQIAENLDADIESVRQGIGSDSRIGYRFIYPGCGYGGSCFPKDVRGITRFAEEKNCNVDLLRAVEKVNNRQKKLLFNKLTSSLGTDLKGKNIAIWGLSFKPGTNDMREAPSKVLIDSILKAKGNIKAFDPKAMDECKNIYAKETKLSFVGDMLEALHEADALLICTEWKVFRQVDFKKLKKRMNNPLIIDGRNMFNPSDLHELGINYVCIGRPSN